MSKCYVKVCGGLGNQLFQIANGYAYSKRFDKELVIDCSTWNASQGTNIKVYKDTLFKNFHFGVKDEPLTLIRERDKQKEQVTIYNEIPNVDGSVLLDGYFQSLKYFEDYKDEFISLLELPEIDSDKIEHPSVGMHVRRGDYLLYRNIYHSCDTEYFASFFDVYKDTHKIYIYTDSPEHILEEFADFDFQLVRSDSELKDFTSLSKHQQIIGSNSTFSWWASLVGNPEKAVFPSKWYVDRPHEDIFREDMILKDV